MENYIGKICPFCKTEIKEGEEVKVCGTCGIPHHVGCWAENKGCTTFGCAEQHYEAQGTNPTEVCDKCGTPLGDGQAFCPKCGTPKISRQTVCGKCGAPINQGQEFCPKCGQKVGVILDANVSSAINQFNATIALPEKKKGSTCSLLAIIFGAIGIIPLLNFIFLLPALILGIIGIFNSKGKKKGRMIASIIVLVISLTVSVAWVGSGIGLFGEDFNDMYSDLDSESWCQIASDGSWMRIDSNPYNIDDKIELEAISKVKQINSELGFGSYVYDEMLETRSVDGTQYESNDDYSISWTYHPDRGLEVKYTIK
jgi:RNA polymerase subunit RPABC4/transcription elongation factor Spt4